MKYEKKKQTDKVDYIGIGQRIRKYRMKNLLSQEQLAEKLDISPTHMSHIETANTKLSLPVFIAITEALSVSADDLLCDKNEASATELYNNILSLLADCSQNELLMTYEIMRSTINTVRNYRE